MAARRFKLPVRAADVLWVDQPERDGTLAFVLRVGAGCVLVAGAVALWAVATGGFDRTDGKLIATSIGFGVYSAFAASGAALVGSPGRDWRGVVGGSGVLASIAAFILLVVALWLPPHDGDGLVRWWAVASLVALWCWHAGVILGPRRDDDGQALVVVSAIAVTALGLDTLGAIAAVAEWLDKPRDPALVQAFATVLVVAVVASVLTPLLRRLQRTQAPTPPATAPVPAPELVPAAAPMVARAAPRRGPSQTVAASWREGDPLTRTLLVACAAAPILAGFALALAWPDTPAPATTRTLTVASPPVTVAPVPPAPSPPDSVTRAPDSRTTADDFSAADSAEIIAARRRGFDREATRNALALAPIVERCFARSEDFTACDTPAELPAAAAAGLSLGTSEAQVSVVASSVTAFTVAAQSRTGTTFTLDRGPTGALRRTCTPAGTGGCRVDATW